MFNQHDHLRGLHAPFGASKSSWLRYDDEKALLTFHNMQAQEQGTILHDWASQTINLGIKQPRSNKTLYSYINDAIGFQMKTEVILYYSNYFFGTADAIKYNPKNRLLRIHDLKTGKTPASMDQLMIYAAFFCLEYKVIPLDIVLRIYQNDEIIEHCPKYEEVQVIMDKIVHIDNLLNESEGRL